MFQGLSKIKIDWLQKIRVLLSAHYIPGPIAGYLLKTFGAEVIKVEPPSGDLMRKFPPFIKSKDSGKMSAYFRALNAGFKSIVIDFKQSAQIDVFKDLIKGSDVIIDGNRANFLTKKVLGCEFSMINPDIIHVPITAYGLKGPLSDMGGHDNNVLSLSGALSYNTIDYRGLPSVSGTQLADITSGYIAAFTALGALFGRMNTYSQEKIRIIDASMLHAASFLNQIYVAGMNATKRSPVANVEFLNGGLSNYTLYRTKDDKAVFFGAIEPKFLENFCLCIDEPDIIEMAKSSDQKQLFAKLEGIFAGKTLNEWEKLLENVDCCFTPVNDLKSSLEMPQAKALELYSTVHDEKYGRLILSNFPAGFTKESFPPSIVELPAPELGEHSINILKDVLQYSDLKIKTYIKQLSSHTNFSQVGFFQQCDQKEMAKAQKEQEENDKRYSPSNPRF